MKNFGFVLMGLFAFSCTPQAGTSGSGNDGKTPEVRVPIVVGNGNNTVDECQGIPVRGECTNPGVAVHCDTANRKRVTTVCESGTSCSAGNGQVAMCRDNTQQDSDLGNPRKADGSCTAEAQKGYCRTQNGVSTAYYYWNDYGSDETGAATPSCKAVHLECGSAELDQYCCEPGEDCSESSNMAHAWCYDAQGGAISGETVESNPTPASGNGGTEPSNPGEPEEEISDQERVRREQEELCQNTGISTWEFYNEHSACSTNYKFFSCEENDAGERQLVEIACGDDNLDGEIRSTFFSPDEEIKYCEMRFEQRFCVDIPDIGI